METFCNNSDNNKSLTPDNIRKAIKVYLNKNDKKYSSENACIEDKFKPKNIISYSERKQMNNDNVWK